MRKGWVAGACALAVAAGAGVAVGTGGDRPATVPPVPPDTIVHNGRITTMDARGSSVQALAIAGGDIVASGRDADVKALAGPGTRMIDLGGRRVLPGLVDAHLHGVRAGTSGCYSRSPRFDALYKRSEALLDVADRARRTPAGQWLFQPAGGWNVAQLDVPGMLTRAELDAIAPSHPVLLQGAGRPGGGAQLNSRGMRVLGLAPGTRGVVLDAAGKATGQVTGAAAARALRTVAAELAGLSVAEQEACTVQLIRELNRRGLTAWDDPGGDGGYAAINRLHREGRLNARIRLNFSCSGAEAGWPCVRASTARQIGETGDETLRIGGVGEEVMRAGAHAVYPSGPYRRILERLARDGWALEHRATEATTQHGMVGDWEAVNRRYPIAGLRWRMLHPGAGPTEPNADALARLKDLDAGVVPIGASVKGGASQPPYRRIYASGTRACLGTDALAAAPYPPFVNLWYAISGKTDVPNQGGVAADQRLTRLQALALATRRCDWFMSLDGRIGALEPGRLADLIVLSDDYFHVPVDRIRTLTSVLTMVGGRVVYGEGRYAELEG